MAIGRCRSFDPNQQENRPAFGTFTENPAFPAWFAFRHGKSALGIGG
jgi:hypothetical protein